MAVEAVGDVVLHNLTDLLIDDSIAFDNVIDQIEEIRIQLRRRRGYLLNAELSNDVNAVSLATDYLQVLFSAGDKIENYVLSLAARGRRNIGFFQRRGFTLFAAAYDACGPAKSLRCELNRLADEIRNLEVKKPGQVVNSSLRARNPDSDEHETRKRNHTTSSSDHGIRSLADQLHLEVPACLLPEERKRLKSMKSSFEFRIPISPGAIRSTRGGHLNHPNHTTAYPDQEGPALIGFNTDRTLLVHRLKGMKPGGRDVGDGVIPLVGPAGSGKTTLVQTIYNLREIKTHFNCRAWVHVPDECITPSHILDNLLQQVLKSKEGGNPSPDQLISQVRDSLKDKRYLVVLDHLSEEGFWGELKSAFPDLGDGVNKVILITRDRKVADSISKQEKCTPLPLSQLCDEHSWELLIKEACLGEASKEVEFGFREEILGKCTGCPLDIVLLGGLLSTKGRSCKEWQWYLSQLNWRGMKILTLSYNDLPAHSKICLLYMALFQNEVDISVRRLHRLWLAEGFIRRSPGMSEEDTVEECFDDLVQRNLIKISKFRSDGSPRRCRLPRALREYLSPIASKISLFYIHQDRQESVSTPKLGVRRVIEYADIKNYCPADNSELSPFDENVRSYLSFNFQRNDTPATEVGNFISKIIGNKGFGVLRVLDLEGVYKPTLPETLKLLFHLRYLGLRWTFIEHLPKSIGDLPYLETLDLKRTYINSLPDSIWKLAHLRHLNLPGIRLDYKQKKGHSSLSELRTLMGMIVDDETTVEAELKKLRELRELGITCRLRDSKELISLILQLTNLKSLWLKSKDKMGRPSKIDLLPLSELSQLSLVSLLGNIGRLPPLNEFPPNLKILALSVSQLNDDPMPVLSKLPNLSVLRLLADSYLGTKMECPRNGFKNLRVLKLWMLKELAEWTVEEGGMPLLKELFIRYCLKLKQLPIQLLHQDALEELTLTAMPPEFVEQVKQQLQNKQKYTVLNLNDYKFTPLPVSGKMILISGTRFEVDHDLDDVAN